MFTLCLHPAGMPETVALHIWDFFLGDSVEITWEMKLSFEDTEGRQKQTDYDRKTHW